MGDDNDVKTRQDQTDRWMAPPNNVESGTEGDEGGWQVQGQGLRSGVGGTMGMQWRGQTQTYNARRIPAAEL
jgi:hypothetical protein